jgi:hypothetical protein
VIDPEFLLDEHDPASDLEAKEEKVEASDRTSADYSAAVGRLLAWFLEGQNLAQIGLRVLVCIHKLRPDLIGGMSFQEISAQAGHGRSAAHNLSEDFERTFPIGQMRLDRSDLARLRYKRSHGYDRGPLPPRTGQMKRATQPARLG